MSHKPRISVLGWQVAFFPQDGTKPIVERRLIGGYAGETVHVAVIEVEEGRYEDRIVQLSVQIF